MASSHGGDMAMGSSEHISQLLHNQQGKRVLPASVWKILEAGSMIYITSLPFLRSVPVIKEAWGTVAGPALVMCLPLGPEWERFVLEEYHRKILD